MKDVLKKSKQEIQQIGEKGDFIEIKKIDILQDKNKVLKTIEIILFETIEPNCFVKKIHEKDSSVGIGVTGMIKSISFKSEKTYTLGTDMYINYEIRFL